MPADRLWHTQVLYHELLLAMQTAEDVMQEPLQALLDGKVQTVEYAGGRVVVEAPRRRRVYLPGSFDPLHDGHRCRPSCMNSNPTSGGAASRACLFPSHTGSRMHTGLRMRRAMSSSCWQPREAVSLRSSLCFALLLTLGKNVRAGSCWRRRARRRGAQRAATR